MPHLPASQALARFRVVDLTQVRAGPTGHINNLKEVFEEPQVRHLGILKKITSKHRGEQTLVSQPITLSRTPSTIARAAPKRGEHSEKILAEIGRKPVFKGK